MSKLTVTLRFNAAPREVYAALTAPENLGDVLPGARAGRILDESGWMAGARILMRTRSGRFQEARVVTDDPDRGVEVLEETGLLDRWILEPEDGGTRVTHVVEGRLTSRQRKRLAREIEEKADRLRRIIENVAAADANPMGNVDADAAESY